MQSPKIKKLWHFQILVHTGAYGAGNFKMLLLVTKFPMVRFSKGYCCHSFHLHVISTKLYRKYGNQGGIQAITFLAICQI